jgi:hypothetical protein
MRKETTVKLFLGIAVLTLFTLNVPAMAAGPKLPTNLCFDRAGGDVLQLVMKSNGTLKSSGGTIKQYGIFGHANTGFPFPVVGNAYVIPASTILHGSVNGAYIVDGVHRNAAFEFLIDIALGTGTSTIWLQRSDGTQVVTSLDINLFACHSQPVAGFVAGDPKPYSDQ